MITKAQLAAQALDAAFTNVNIEKATLPEWKKDLLNALYHHALAQYGNGYDVVIECYSIKDVLEIVGSAYTMKTYIARMDAVVGLRQEQMSNCY
jgi:hypothetical protein